MEPHLTDFFVIWGAAWKTSSVGAARGVLVDGARYTYWFTDVYALIVPIDQTKTWRPAHGA